MSYSREGYPRLQVGRMRVGVTCKSLSPSTHLPLSLCRKVNNIYFWGLTGICWDMLKRINVKGEFDLTYLYYCLNYFTARMYPLLFSNS